MFLPSSLISAGAVLFLDGIAIYDYHNDNVNIDCSDARDPLSNDIHKELNYIPVEFAGLVTSMLFFVSL